MLCYALNVAVHVSDIWSVHLYTKCMSVCFLFYLFFILSFSFIHSFFLFFLSSINQPLIMNNQSPMDFDEIKALLQP